MNTYVAAGILSAINSISTGLTVQMRLMAYLVQLAISGITDVRVNSVMCIPSSIDKYFGLDLIYNIKHMVNMAKMSRAQA